MSSVTSSYIVFLKYISCTCKQNHANSCPVVHVYRNNNGADQPAHAQADLRLCCYLFKYSTCNAMFAASDISRFCLVSVAGKCSV